MIANEILIKIENAPISERIHIIEYILQSLKHDMQPTTMPKVRQRKPFQVRSFNLGQDVHCDRDEIYAERG
ncbi:hypothetical protein [Desulfonatronovibrio magnus]|uniref:hypothetical protein n=1 Tax=Desulfonatronovibrio magnus TaxID=698827 RepID=UPI0005EAF176|nr:hypothetical protein [Desulfonatronovibrio magnus]